MITIRIPALWQPEAGASEIALEADNVEGALRALVIHSPRLASRIFDADGGLHGGLHLFVNHEALRFHGDLAAALNDGDEISIAPMISGG